MRKWENLRSLELWAWSQVTGQEEDDDDDGVELSHLFPHNAVSSFPVIVFPSSLLLSRDAVDSGVALLTEKRCSNDP